MVVEVYLYIKVIEIPQRPLAILTIFPFNWINFIGGKKHVLMKR